MEEDFKREACCSSSKRYGAISLDDFSSRWASRVGDEIVAHPKQLSSQGHRVYLPLYMFLRVGELRVASEGGRAEEEKSKLAEIAHAQPSPIQSLWQEGLLPSLPDN